MKLRRKVTIGALAAAASGLVGSAAVGQTSMVGQAHDFSSMAWSQGQICLPCHTPHNAISDELGNRAGKLWNHKLTTATYTLYDGSTGDSINDFDRLSRLCMSCHDGTVALDSFGGQTGTSFIDTEHRLGTDLTNDHPIGSTAVYPEAGLPWFNAATNHKLGPNGELRLREMDITGVPTYVVGCMTCHTPHYKGFDDQLRMTNAGSALCLSCHIK